MQSFADIRTEAFVFGPGGDGTEDGDRRAVTGGDGGLQAGGDGGLQAGGDGG